MSHGFHPCNVGLLSTGRPGLRPCTPAGVIQILKRYQIPIAGRNAVVVGRSDIVGKPMAMLLLQENATVTQCATRAPAICPMFAGRREILIAAIGRPAMITAGYITPGAVVVDVGMNQVDSESGRRSASSTRPGSPDFDRTREPCWWEMCIRGTWRARLRRTPRSREASARSRLRC